jgi:hypothetical protein
MCQSHTFGVGGDWILPDTPSRTSRCDRAHEGNH